MDKPTKLPETPGIYKMLDKNGNVIYVGKAKNLRNRINTYFQKDYSHSSRTRKLMENAEDIQFIQTDTELESLILENTLIKDLRPKYNILMKDDKSYVYIKVDRSEDFPRITIVREQTVKKLGKSQGAKYFGPKLASQKVYSTMRMIKKLFPFRHCQLDIKFLPDSEKVEVKNKVIDFPCLDYFIKRCPGPCIGAIKPVEYKKIVQQIIDFLDGKSDELENSLKLQMQEAAKEKLFEKAARIRDKLFTLQSITERQKVTDPDRKDTDVINFTTDLGHIYFNIFQIRGGKLINQENFTLDALEMEEKDSVIDLDETLESFLTQYYEKTYDIPKEILIPEELADKTTLEIWLKERKGETVNILSPKKGEKNKLLELSFKNAISFSKQYKIKWLAEQSGETALSRLAEVLGMKDKKLKRIEGFDISHLSGDQTVGSMVVFTNGVPFSDHYRQFKMRTVIGKPDDYRSMEEVLMRRLKYLRKTDKSFTIKKPTKKIFTEMKDANGKTEDYLCLIENKKSFGYLKHKKTSNNSCEIINMWIDDGKRGQKLGYELLKKFIVKSKYKKFYAFINASLENYYAEFGFKPVKELPTYFKPHKNKILMVMEKFNLRKDDPSFNSKPNLILIDGGKGQLSTAVMVLKRLSLDIPVISLAKKLEEIFQPGKKAPILLEEGDEALKLLQKIRDESHRFAITFQRNLHRKALLT